MKVQGIHADFQNTPGDSAISYLTVVKWISEFKFGLESLDVIRVVDGQTSATIPEFIAKMH